MLYSRKILSALWVRENMVVNYQTNIVPDGEYLTDNNIEQIWFLNRLLTEKFMDQLTVNTDLNRRLVSYQGNKLINGHRWYNYREGFSSELVGYCISQLRMQGPILDPFAGSGTTLFTSSRLGIDSVGIELLPNSLQNIEFRKLVHSCGSYEWLTEVIRFLEKRSWESSGPLLPLNELRITRNAYPENTKTKLERFLFEVSEIDKLPIKNALLFAVMCILEKISFTRKDGQYLRWDSRSNRQTGKKHFNKGKIYSFDEALETKIREIVEDMGIEDTTIKDKLEDVPLGEIELLSGSCLKRLPSLASCSISGIITSPPYCNRYDYTRTYALELAFLGVSEEKLKALRQDMLSCTVENKEKTDVSDIFSKDSFTIGSSAFYKQELLQEIIRYLDMYRERKLLNNPGIVRMVKNYFLEIALVISDCYRILKPGAFFVMVNDNVQYQGVPVAVDLILSDIADQIGFNVERIWVLPTGKGNSSQQMGRYGRQELRKCVYIWRKPINIDDKLSIKITRD